MSRFDIEETTIDGVKLISRQKLADQRGHLTRLFCSQELDALGWSKPVMQVNETGTHDKGTVRGLHFQTKPNLEMKLVGCLQGAIFDVAVDLRKSSPTFLKHFSYELSESNQKSLLIPEGVAHGFQALTENVRMIYFHSAPYDPNSEGGLRFDDKHLAIKWPLPPQHISQRDLAFQTIDEHFNGIDL